MLPPASGFFRIASCSKPLTSLAIQKLIEQGLLTLDTTPFGQIFTETPLDRNLKKLTIRQILTHKSFFPDDPLVWATTILQWTSTPSPAVFVHAGRTGDSYYQNSNYHLLTLVIEAVSKRILQPKLPKAIIYNPHAHIPSPR
jgi:CubicO group peptidase (beta-lactamase class C family)